MVKTQISMDNCGFETIIEATSTDDGNVKLVITSKCKSIQKIAEELDEVDPFTIVGQPILKCPIYEIASKHLRHPACFVPPSIIRTIKVESGMALAGNSSITVEKK